MYVECSRARFMRTFQRLNSAPINPCRVSTDQTMKTSQKRRTYPGRRQTNKGQELEQVPFSLVQDLKKHHASCLERVKRLQGQRCHNAAKQRHDDDLWWEKGCKVFQRIQNAGYWAGMCYNRSIKAYPEARTCQKRRPFQQH